MANDRPKNFILNGAIHSDVAADGTVLLDYLRVKKRLTGTKEGCREGDCGACAVLLGELKNEKVTYTVVNSCLLPMGAVSGKHVVTIEGLSGGNNPLQNAFVEKNASQCGFCTPGMIIALTGYFLSANHINPDGAIRALDGNICRCTGYLSIKRAVAHACEELQKYSNANHLDKLIQAGIVPEYFKTIPEQLSALHQPLLYNYEGIFVAGGTDLFVQQPEKLERSTIQFLTKNATPVWQNGDTCYMDATATVTDLSESALLHKILPRLDDYIELISSTPIRNRATLGGNLVNASPIGDLSILFLALDASLILSKSENERRIKLKDFFLDYKKINLDPGEIIKTLYFKIPDSFLFNFEKVSKRRYLDIAGVNSAMFLREADGVIQDIRISAGGVAPIPLFLSKTCSFLTNKNIEPGVIQQAIKMADSEISPISDVRGSEQYKRVLLGRLILAHFITLVPEYAEEVTA